MAFPGPPSISPPLPTAAGVPAAQVTSELGLLAVRVLGQEGGTGVPGKDQYFEQGGKRTVTVPGSGQTAILFPVPFPKELTCVTVTTSWDTVKIASQSRTGFTVITPSGLTTINWRALGC